MTVDRSRLLARLRSMFADELTEQAAALNDDLLALERAPADVERLRSVFRVFHTLKGAARAADVPTVESFCHAIESLLAGARDGGTPLTTGQLTTLFAAADTLADASRRLREGGELSDAPLDAILDRMTAGSAVAAPVEPAAQPAIERRNEPAVEPTSEPTVQPEPAPAVTAAAAPAATAGERAEPVRVSAAKLDAMVGITGDVADVASSLTGHAGAADGLARAAARLHRAAERAARARGPSVLGAAAGGGARLPNETLPQQLRTLVADAVLLARQLRGDARALSRAGGQLADGVRELRLRPVADVVEALPRVVRDLGLELGKEVDLVLLGTGVEADRAVLAGLADALLHLVRNAIDHGIEPPAVRAARGKPPRATLTVGATLVGDRLRVEVADDGRGLDADAIRATLRQHGRAAPADPASLGAALLAGGLSTRSEATAISGRGVGLDAVRATIERLGGTVAVSWDEGHGTRFTLEMPITLAVIRALVVRVGEARYAIPTGAVDRVLRIAPDDVGRVDGRPMLVPRAGPPTAVAQLARVLGPPLVERTFDGRMPAVLLAVGGMRRALLVDELLDERELVVRPLEQAGPAVAARYTGAATESAGIVLVLNPSHLVAEGRDALGEPLFHSRADAIAVRRILVVDDSITTRTLEESVLSAAGYDVTTAVDGAQAWELVQAGRADLVVSDVEMPRMDGITLCETIRASEKFGTLPVILVTSLDRPEHRARGLEAGADAYVTKSSFDQDELLQTVAQLLGTPR